MEKRWLKKGKQIICGLCICAAVTGMLSACSKGDGSRNNTATAPTQKPLVSEEDTDSNLGRWARAMGSVLISMNDGNVYYFGGYEHTEGNRKAAADILKQSWNISDRIGLLTQIHSLLKEGARTEYRKQAKEMNAMSAKQLRTAMKQLSGDLKVHYEMVQYNWNAWNKNGLLAWDMCRISHLAQWGYVAGYLDIKEAQAIIEPAARKLKDNFTSWEDVQKNWLDGYALYASIDATAGTGTDYEARKKVYEELKERDAKQKDNVLFDDSLFTQDIIPLAGVTADVFWKEVLDAAAETREAVSSHDKKVSASPKATEKGASE